MKPSYLIWSAIALLPVASFGFTTTFPASTFDNGTEVQGKDGWGISDPGSDLDGDSIPDGYLSFVTSLNGSAAAAVGGYYNAPLVPAPTTVFLSHAAPSDLQFTTFSASFDIAGSDEFAPGRDGFGFGFRDSSNNSLFTVSFVPVGGASADTYQVTYKVGNTSFDALTGTGGNIIIHANSLYSISLAFSPAGANPTFTASISGTSTTTFSGVATGMGSAQVARFGAEWNTIAGQEGDNYLVFDNVTAVPEASASLLLGAGAIGLMARRRRA